MSSRAIKAGSVLVILLVAAFFAAILRAGEPDPVASRPAMVVVPVDDADFVPVIRERPELAQIAVLRGDPDSGPSDMLLRMSRGDGRRHVHSSAYRLAVIRGQMKHWHSPDDRARTSVLGPGSYWYQPGGEPHGDDCLSDECVMFISWEGRRDTKLAE